MQRIISVCVNSYSLNQSQYQCFVYATYINNITRLLNHYETVPANWIILDADIYNAFKLARKANNREKLEQ